MSYLLRVAIWYDAGSVRLGTAAPITDEIQTNPQNALEIMNL